MTFTLEKVNEDSMIEKLNISRPLRNRIIFQVITLNVVKSFRIISKAFLFVIRQRITWPWTQLSTVTHRRSFQIFLTEATSPGDFQDKLIILESLCASWKFQFTLFILHDSQQAVKTFKAVIQLQLSVGEYCDKLWHVLPRSHFNAYALVLNGPGW